MPVMSSALVVHASFGSIVQIYTFNKSIQYYNNLDVMPVYQSLILLMMLLCGWMLLNEIQYYAWK